MSTNVVRVLVADQYPVVREGVKEILSRSDSIVVGEAGSSGEVLEMIRHQELDLLVLDASWPDMGGLEVLRRVKSTRPELTVLMMGVHSEKLYGARALRIGAAGYLEKEAAPEEFQRAIRQILAGRVYVSERLAESLARNLATDDLDPQAKLSDREYEVMRQLASGKRTTEIAQDLCLSVKTISTYRTRILQKLSMRSTAEVIAYAVRQGIVE